MTSSTVLFGRLISRRSLRISTALAGTLGFAAIATPAAAQQCGIPVDGRVTCTTAGNPYSAGVTYTFVVPPLTVVMQDGVLVSSPAGIRLSGTGAIVLQGGGASLNSSDAGVLANSFTGDAAVAIGNVATTGIGARAAAIGAFGTNVLVNAGNLSTTGAGARGLNISARQDAAVTVASITTSGSLSLGAFVSATENAAVTIGNVVTAGADSDGVIVNGRTATVNVGTVSTAGLSADGIRLATQDGATLTFNTVSTTGAGAIGVEVVNSVSGPTVVRGQSVTTTGANSDALLVGSLGTSGNVSVTTTGTVSATGANSIGVAAISLGGTANVAVNNVNTVAAAAADIGASQFAVGAQGTSASVNASGTVSSSGAANTINVLANNGTATATVNAVNSGTAGVAGGSALLVTATQDASASVGGAVRSLGTGGQGVQVTAGRNAIMFASTGSSISTVGNAVTLNAGVTPAGAATGIGNVTANIGGAVTTTGANAAGITANGTAVALTAGNVTTGGATANGITVAARGGASTVVAADIVASGAGSTGISARNTGGNISATARNVTVNGANGVGILAVATGTGAATAGSTGTVTATGTNGAGLRAEAGTAGTATVNAVNVSSVRDAVFATGGNAVVVATGAIATTGAGDTVTANATSGNATATVNAVTTGAAGTRAVFVNASQDATATINGRVASTGTGAPVFVNGGRNAIVNLGTGSAVTGTGDAIVVTSGTGTTTINNAGTVANNPNGFAIRVVGGPATINNSGTMTGDIQLTGGADRINNSGTFLVGPNPDFGAGADVFANSGFVRLSPGATAAVTTATFTGLESFQNTGTIDLRNGIVGDVLTIPGTYSGAGAAALGVDVAQGANVLTADRLVITGAATGTTIVAINQVGGGAPTLNAGTTVVQAGAGSSAGAFTLLGGPRTQGLVRYELVFNAANNTFNLVGTPSDAAFQTLNYLEGTRNLWLESADVVSAQLRARRDALWAFGGGDPAGRMWMQIHGSVDTRQRAQNFTAFGQTRLVDFGFEQDYFGGQIGFDFTGGVGDRGGFAFGVTGGYINSDMSFAGGPDRIGFDVINGGVYGSFSAGNVFVNVLGKYDYFWADANSQRAGFQVDEKGGVYGVRGEAGIRFGSDSFFIEPAASISWVKSDFDNFTSAGTQINFRDDDGLRGRFGGRVGGQFNAGGAVVALHVGGNYVHEFQGQDTVTLVSGGQTLTFGNPRIRDYGEGVIGMTIGQSEGISGFLEGTYSRSFNRRAGLLDQEGAGGRAGLRLRF